MSEHRNTYIHKSITHTRYKLLMSYFLNLIKAIFFNRITGLHGQHIGQISEQSNKRMSVPVNHAYKGVQTDRQTDKQTADSMGTTVAFSQIGYGLISRHLSRPLPYRVPSWCSLLLCKSCSTQTTWYITNFDSFKSNHTVENFVKLCLLYIKNIYIYIQNILPYLHQIFTKYLYKEKYNTCRSCR